MAKEDKKIEILLKEQQPLQIIAHPGTQKGNYSNVALVHHNENEFILDFLFKVESDPHLVSRIIISPNHMERLVHALTDNLEKFKSLKKKKK